MEGLKVKLRQYRHQTPFIISVKKRKIFYRAEVESYSDRRYDSRTLFASLLAWMELISSHTYKVRNVFELSDLDRKLISAMREFFSHLFIFEMV